jgi:Family of unknown function (DUF6343)
VSDRSGSEPVTARSALRARTALASLAVLFGLAAAVGLWWFRPEDSTAFEIGALLCLLVAAIAAVDLAVVVRRLRGNR